MRLLLDTRAVLWWLMDDPHLSPGARTAIADPANQLLVSAAIGYELAYKQRLGRLPAAPENLSRRLLKERIECHTRPKISSGGGRRRDWKPSRASAALPSHTPHSPQSNRVGSRCLMLSAT
jgi:hypothetical protein